MSGRHKLFIVLGAVSALAATIAVVAIFAGSFSAAGFVADKYRRASTQDVDDATAYTAGHPADRVAATITRAWRPIESYHDSSGHYLRYSGDVIAIFPRGSGSLIMVEDIDRAYRRYSSVVRHHRTYRPEYRDGGPGSGK